MPKFYIEVGVLLESPAQKLKLYHDSLATLWIEKDKSKHIYHHNNTTSMHANCFPGKSVVRVLTLSKDDKNVTKGSKGDGNAHYENDPFTVHQF